MTPPERRATAPHPAPPARADADPAPPRRSGAPGQVIVPVQVLRGVAASFVVTAHLLERLEKRGAFPHGLPDWAESFGQMGVVTFFVISGFIMVWTTMAAFGQPGAPATFFRRRIERIVPLYYLATIVMIGFAALTQRYSTASYTPPTAWTLLLSALFVPYMDRDGIAHPVYGLGWTLEYEMFFYAIFALALFLPPRRGMVLTIAVLLAVVAWGATLEPPAAGYGTPLPVFYLTRPIMLYFVVGMALAWVRLAWGTLHLRLSDWLVCAATVALLAAGVRLGGRDLGLASAVSVAAAVALATLVAGRGLGATRAGRLGQRFGDVSYSIYLTHSFLLGAFAVATTRLAARGWTATAVVALAACLACALAAWPVWRFVERPLTRALQRRHPRLPAPARDGPAAP